ncbi:MAG: DNA gyrase inhibitor YacG [Sulfuricella sp.]|nr:DNA gyrase inhibitor YacG [Sulfuricella sp.]
MNSATKPAPTVPCPICGNPALFSPQNLFRPFCSERCKLIDLGQWATESYRIPLSEEEAAKDNGDLN